MENTISFSYPWWYLVFCVALGVGYALLMYYRDKKFSDFNPLLVRALALLRGIATFFIALLLLSPFIKLIKEDIKTPVIVIASDKSESVVVGETAENLDLYDKSLAGLVDKLSSKYEVQQITFGSQVHDHLQDSLSDQSTNLSHAFKYIGDNYGDQNLGAIIIGTDGIYNEGGNPLYTDYRIHAPVFTIALGDTTERKDLLVQNILYNRIAYLGDKFPVQVDISAYNCSPGNTTVILEQVSGSTTRKIAEEQVTINNRNFFRTLNFNIEATQSGVMRYRVRLTPINDEFNLSNNIREFYIEVMDARQKILLVANGPHPDLAAIKNAITVNKNYEVDQAFISDFNKNVGDYNMAIFHNLPSETGDITSIIRQMDKNEIPRIFIVGMQTDLPKFNTVQDVIGIAGNSRSIEEIQADLNPAFSEFTTSDELKSSLHIFPPLQTPFGEYKLNGTGSVYLFQNIKKIKTNYPLITFDDKNGTRTTVITGEGLWKWRLFDYLQHQNYNLADEIISKTVLLTSVKADKRKFRVNTSKSAYKDNEKVIFDAQLYNDSYEMINEPDVKLVVTDEDGREYVYTFSKTENYYSLNADLFAAGNYRYTASTIFNGKTLTATGAFSVESLQLELYDLQARHGLLKSVSEKYGGQMVYPKDINQLADLILENDGIKPVMYESRSTKPIIHLKGLFFLILGLLSVEWFLRRFFGNY